MWLSQVSEAPGKGFAKPEGENRDSFRISNACMYTIDSEIPVIDT